jgi:menaquinol-cytochrome c reductase iron-sulfur subunit
MSDDDRGDSPASSVPSRRRFLKIATCAVGGGIGAVVAVPAAQYLIAPVGGRIVTESGDPIDAIGIDRLPTDGAPVRVPLVAAAQRDAWTTVRDVPLGAAWLQRRGEPVTALSAVCPHLGCAVGWNGARKSFQCPCHESAFADSGDRMSGPAERGLDPLPVTVENGRVKVTWIRFRAGGTERVKL